MSTQAYIDGDGFPTSAAGTAGTPSVNSINFPVTGTGAFQNPGGLPVRYVLITCGLSGDTGYATGGYALTATQFGIGAILGIIVIGYNTAATSYLFEWNSQTAKLQVFTAPGTEVSSTTDLHTVTIACRVEGGY